MKIQPVKGTRDFFPPLMAIRNFISDNWQKSSLRNGFEEYDGPIFEYLKMYTIKSGDEIVEQLFNLTDRGGRDLAIRPEITPTLARMVNQQINSLSKPIKWFSMPRICRAERPQKGRLREFFQWNIDIIGVEDTAADAEIIYTTIDSLRSFGLTSSDIKIKLSSRRLLAAVLVDLGLSPDSFDKIYPLLDKKTKLPPETFEKLLMEAVGDKTILGAILDFMNLDDFSAINVTSDSVAQAKAEQKQLVDQLSIMGMGDYLEFDPSIVRGLAYYTGMVFEVHDTSGEFRAIAGGGRYDDLLKQFGGPSVTATGMGMGDCVLELLLREKGLLSDTIGTGGLDYFVFCEPDIIPEDDVAATDRAMEVVARLRTAGFAAEFSYKTTKIAKQLKQSSAQSAKYCIIFAQEFLAKSRNLIIKNMSTGEQKQVPIQDFYEQIEAKAKQ